MYDLDPTIAIRKPLAFPTVVLNVRECLSKVWRDRTVGLEQADRGRPNSDGSLSRTPCTRRDRHDESDGNWCKQRDPQMRGCFSQETLYPPTHRSTYLRSTPKLAATRRTSAIARWATA